MTKDFKSGNVKHLPFKNVDLPNFVNNFSRKENPQNGDWNYRLEGSEGLG